MPFLSPLRAVAASALALAVATTTGVVLAETPAQSYAVPAQVDAAALAVLEAEQRQTLITSRAQEREELAASVQQLAQQRTAALAETGSKIDATEKAVQERLAAEKAEAERLAEEAKKAQAAKKAAATPKGGTRAQNKELGRQLALQLYGWGGDQFKCYDNIIMRESLWDQYADNPNSSAYGIPQALPGKKMASEGADWKTNPETQIRWGLKYVKERFGTPCKAWAFKRANGWY